MNARLEERVMKFNEWAKRKGYSTLQIHNGRFYGVWMMGNNYRKTANYFGAYPRGYWQRIQILFSDVLEYGTILHLFSGTIQGDCKKVWTVDIDPDTNPCICASADNFAHLVPEHVRFDIAFADPPYNDNWKKYPRAKKVSSRKVLYEVYKVLKDGGFLVWLDTKFPQYSRNMYELVGIVAILTSTNHVVRGMFVFEKVKEVTKE